MKKKTALLASCLLGTFAFSSCEKNLYDESKQPEKEITVKDLEIPEDFQWKLSQTAEGTVSATTPTLVSFFLDETCSKEEKLATIPVYAETSSLPLSIPTYAKTLYAQYETKANGIKKVAIPIADNGSFFLNITDGQKSTARAITRGHDIEDDIEFDKGKGVVFHPKKDWGTIMFEDQFPSLGDYDFNDFVVNYKVQFEVEKEKGNEYTSDMMLIGLRLKAVGGIFPYSPCLRLKEIKRSEATVTIMNPKTREKLEEAKYIDNKKNELIIDCGLLIKNLSKGGSKYYNTEKDYLIDTDELPEIAILIELNDKKEVKEILEDDEFDLYLRHNNGTEIHINGIEPVAYKYPFGNPDLLPVSESDGDEEDDNYYFSKERLIWGLRVPGNAAHAIEGANFLNAYKGFAKWAQSGGKNEQNWYGQGNADKSLLIYN